MTKPSKGRCPKCDTNHEDIDRHWYEVHGVDNVAKWYKDELTRWQNGVAETDLYDFLED